MKIRIMYHVDSWQDRVFYRRFHIEGESVLKAQVVFIRRVFESPKSPFCHRKTVVVATLSHTWNHEGTLAPTLAALCFGMVLNSAGL